MRIRPPYPPLVALLAALALLALPLGAAAQKKTKSVQTEARWVGFDLEAKTVTVKIVKPGDIQDRDQRNEIKAGKEVVFDAEPEGSVLTRTTVAINGIRSELGDIDVGKRVYVYWVPDEARPHGRFARKIDVIFTTRELEERYGIEDE